MKEKRSRSLELYRVIFFMLTAAVMTVIFILSAQDAKESSGTSRRLTRLMVKLISGDYDSLSPVQQQEIWSKASFIVRKLAHFTIYAALGFCASFTAGKRKLFSPGSLGVIISGFLYAVSDEFHQHFVPGRSCEFRDMMIDTGGVLTGMLGMFMITALLSVFIRYKKA